MIQGSCLCRRVTYQATELVGPHVYCHCESCRKASGSAFGANVSAPMNGFSVLSGAGQIAVYESSPGKRRHFCRNCGSPLFTTVGDDPDVVRVRLGTLDSLYNRELAAHIFVEEKPAWHEIEDSAPQFERWPERSKIAIPGSKQDDA